jgi:plasmid segregation protein ParM
MASRDGDLVVSVNGGTAYAVGDTALRQGGQARATLAPSRTRTPEMAALFAAGLGCVASPAGGALRVVTGLPPESLNADKPWLESAYVRTWEFELNGEPRRVDVGQLVVIPQGAGAYFDHLLTMTVLQPQTPPDGAVAIIDIGYLTVDFVMIEDGELVTSATGSLRGGMAAVYRRCAETLAQRYPLVAEERVVEQVLRDGVVHHMGERCPVDRSLVRNVFLAFAERILARAQSLWSSKGNTIKLVLLCGGGAPVVETMLRQRWPHVQMLKDPARANVRGYLKVAMQIG